MCSSSSTLEQQREDWKRQREAFIQQRHQAPTQSPLDQNLQVDRQHFTHAPTATRLSNFQ